MTRIAGFSETSEYRHSDGLYYEDFFHIGGAGRTGVEHVWHLSDTDQLVWVSQAHRDWFERSFPHGSSGRPLAANLGGIAPAAVAVADGSDLETDVGGPYEPEHASSAALHVAPVGAPARNVHVPRWLWWTLLGLVATGLVFAYEGVNGVICSGLLVLVLVSLFARARRFDEQGDQVSMRLLLSSPASQKQSGREQSAMVCPHCQSKGTVRTRSIIEKKGVSGGKATAAVLTGGLSMLATGLSRKEHNTEAHCSQCGNTWRF